VGNMPSQREDNTQHWSRGDFVEVRSKAADDWRDAYVLIQRGRKLLLVIPEGMIHPGVIPSCPRRNPEPIIVRLMAWTTKSKRHHESATMASQRHGAQPVERSACVEPQVDSKVALYRAITNSSLEPVPSPVVFCTRCR
jgi:hypothetical protein